MCAERSYEYKNDFLYFVIRPGKDRSRDQLIYCSGVNISLFSAITSGRHGIASNPAMRGLQLVNLDVRDLILSRGATPKTLRGNDCSSITPARDTWYTELLSIQNAPVSLPDEIIDFGVISLLKKIYTASRRELHLPADMPGPQDLQSFLEAECRKCRG